MIINTTLLLQQSFCNLTYDNLEILVIQYLMKVQLLCGRSVKSSIGESSPKTEISPFYQEKICIIETGRSQGHT